MPWAKFDDRFPSNRKVRLLSDGAFRLYVSAICWSAENLTDGVIKTAELRLVADVRAARTRAKELVDHGLWEVISNVGWRIHDYHDYNPTAAQARDQKKAKTARQQRWRNSKRGDDDDSDGARVDASTDASRDASRDGAGDAAPTRPDPYPSVNGAGGWVPDPQRRAAAPASLRSAGLPSEPVVDHLPAEEIPPVAGTATIPGVSDLAERLELSELGERCEAALEGRMSPEAVEMLVLEVDQAKRHHMQGCGRCQRRTAPCPPVAPLVAWWAQLGASTPLGAAAPF